MGTVTTIAIGATMTIVGMGIGIAIVTAGRSLT
jgi:hypothetical protein